MLCPWGTVGGLWRSQGLLVAVASSSEQLKGEKGLCEGGFVVGDILLSVPHVLFWGGVPFGALAGGAELPWWPWSFVS